MGKKKLLDLKYSLEKLINPFETRDSSNGFSIEIIAQSELSADEKEKIPRRKVNGPITNFVFETLNVKTTQIQTTVLPNGKEIITELIDRGAPIYKIGEKNNYKGADDNSKVYPLANIKFHLFYLNQAAKINFKKQMGIASHRFGSVFVYRNGFRVYPYGEPGYDVFNIDTRKAQGHYRFLGTRDLLGRIEITDSIGLTKESSSREGGLAKNETYESITQCFIEKCLARLERYVVDIQWPLGDKGEGLDKIETLGGKEKIIELVSALSDAKDISLLEYNKDFLDIVKEKADDSDEAMFNHLKNIASKLGDKQYLSRIRKAERRYYDEKAARKDVERELEDTVKQNLFLKSVKSQDLDEIISFLHHIGIAANTVDNYMVGIYKRLNKNEVIKPEQLREIIEIVSFENRKIMSISRFATKANFKLFTEETTVDLVNYIEEYIFNVIKNIKSQNFSIKLKLNQDFEFNWKFRPIEINIIIDNLISNAKKAGATLFEIILEYVNSTTLKLHFKDNGEGIPPQNIPKIFDFGFTTTSGSGLGLFHVLKIVKQFKGTINVHSIPKRGTEFVITIKK